jgi:hypothetical protein
MTPYERDDRAEQAFRDAFRTRAEALEPEVLSGDPVRTHRRAWPFVLVAAAAVLVLAIGTLVWRSTGSDHAAPAVGSDVTLPDGWRWESHADVEVAVPDSWGYAYAPTDQWCIGYDSDGKPHNPRTPALPTEGYVNLASAGMGSTAVACPAEVPPVALFVVHLSFLDDSPAPPVPQGWSNVTRSVGHTRVNVVTDPAHQALADRILATAHVVTVDANGCSATSPIQAAHAVRPDPAFDVSALTGVDSIAVCQYLTDGTGGPGLVASRLLTGSDGDAELSALRSAPTGGGPDRPANCTPDGWGMSGVVLRLNADGQTHEMYGYYEWCFGNGFDDGTVVRELTPGDCQPIWGDRVLLLGGSSAPFERCQPTVTY